MTATIIPLAASFRPCPDLPRRCVIYLLIQLFLIS
jgi:hypothetical protein